DPAFADRVRDIEGAVHHDVGDGVEAARAQVLGAGDEISGSIVDQIGQRTGRENVRHHRIDRAGVTNVHAVTRDLAAVHEFGGGLIADAFAAAADEEPGAKREEFLRHALSQSGATAAHQNTPAAQQSVLEHPCPSRFLFVRVGYQPGSASRLSITSASSGMVRIVAPCASMSPEAQQSANSRTREPISAESRTACSTENCVASPMIFTRLTPRSLSAASRSVRRKPLLQFVVTTISSAAGSKPAYAAAPHESRLSAPSVSVFRNRRQLRNRSG